MLSDLLCSFVNVLGLSVSGISFAFPPLILSNAENTFVNVLGVTFFSVCCMSLVAFVNVILVKSEVP